MIPAPASAVHREVKPVARDVIVGEPLPHGSTIITGVNSEADLLLTTGSLAKVGPNSKLVLNAFWQKDFRASAKKVTDLKEETSPSRVALKLETGDLVVDVKKLNRESSFVVESELGVAGIRGTQFGLSTNSILPNWQYWKEGLDFWTRIKKPGVWRPLKRLQVQRMERAK